MILLFLTVAIFIWYWIDCMDFGLSWMGTTEIRWFLLILNYFYLLRFRIVGWSWLVSLSNLVAMNLLFCCLCIIRTGFVIDIYWWRWIRWIFPAFIVDQAYWTSSATIFLFALFYWIRIFPFDDLWNLPHSIGRLFKLFLSVWATTSVSTGISYFTVFALFL